ncbi:hypothetical protein XELAEV_18014774mg [Xenopus laevis]|uniref:Uncharacterized protein n=1 Tax=Xenopus laevis TaxID=8355 RepID=A0A974HVA3_XENLA|nr:hypothetical protein XELAEV_18014774mg [Xenopus laevis]
MVEGLERTTVLRQLCIAVNKWVQRKLRVLLNYCMLRIHFHWNNSKVINTIKIESILIVGYIYSGIKIKANLSTFLYLCSQLIGILKLLPFNLKPIC